MKEIRREIAKHPGHCYQCGHTIYVGDYIVVYELPMEKIVAKHFGCIEDTAAGPKA